ncbi:MAG: hypothetical protein ACP5IT_02510 [Thermoproteota archaeon]
MKRTRTLTFTPRATVYEFELYLSGSFEEKVIENNEIYSLVKKLVSKVFVTYQDKFEKRWFYFFLPLRIRKRFICIPFAVVKYKKDFFVSFKRLHTNSMRIKKGNKRYEDFYFNIFKDAIRFLPLTEKLNPEKFIPYDIRQGKIKGKFVLRKVMSKEEAEEIKREYKKQLERRTERVSLSDYLNACAISYRAAFGDKVQHLKPVEMYKKFADGRDCGMLEIKDYDSKEEFEAWLKEKSHCGGHPFEIVFSWLGHGIHLYPPEEDSPYFLLNVTNYGYAEEFVKMLKSLIENKIPVRTYDLDEVLEFLTGESYIRVNDYGEHYIDYIFFSGGKEEKHLLPFIEWDEVTPVRLKSRKVK